MADESGCAPLFLFVCFSTASDERLECGRIGLHPVPADNKSYSLSLFMYKLKLLMTISTSIKEKLVYVGLWVLLFATPLLTFYLHSLNKPTVVFAWPDVFGIWMLFGTYLFFFLIHNSFVSPQLVYGHHAVRYLLLVLLLLCGFGIGRHLLSKTEVGRKFIPHGRPPEMMDGKIKDGAQSDDDGLKTWRGWRNHPHGNGQRKRFYHHPMHDGFPPGPIMLLGEKDFLAYSILVLLFGMNIGIKLYFKNENDAHALEQLQQKNVEEQLKYLKYQINPHFFMNTLNNIHTLIDIDPDKAKEALIELSKMMRYVLYEANNAMVPLDREVEFLRNYIRLMRLRYTDDLKISVSLPNEVPNRQVPPLIFITFVENAFKHGVSYAHNSFIDIKLSIDDTSTLFCCRNSRSEKTEGHKEGVGLNNVRQRLQLIYGESYALRITDGGDAYDVSLSLPVQIQSSTTND